MNNSIYDLRPFRYIFRQNPTKPDIFDIEDGPEPSGLKYIRISPPIKEYLKRRGAKLVLESHNKNQRILFTGLIPLVTNWYFGDVANTEKVTRHTIALKYHKESREATLYIFPFDLESNEQRRKFLNQELRKGQHR